jgi:hypothetical protein
MEKMKQALVIQEENTRLTLLEDCERKIASALRRGIEATVSIGQQLNKIDEMELYTEKGYTTLNEYCFDCHNLDPRSVSRFMGIAESAKALKDAGMELPIYESHVAELAQLDPADRPLVWERIVKSAAKRDEPITTQLVREAVEFRGKELKAQQAAQQAPPATKATGSARISLEEPDLDLGSDLSEETSERSSGQPEAPAPRRITLTEDGERDLERIRRLCGDKVADSIEYLHLQMSERELHLWAQEPDPNTLVHYIFDLLWSVPRALGFVRQTITERTNIGRLIILARANGGQFQAEMDRTKITVETLA